MQLFSFVLYLRCLWLYLCSLFFALKQLHSQFRFRICWIFPPTTPEQNYRLLTRVSFFLNSFLLCFDLLRSNWSNNSRGFRTRSRSRWYLRFPRWQYITGRHCVGVKAWELDNQTACFKWRKPSLKVFKGKGKRKERKKRKNVFDFFVCSEIMWLILFQCWFLLWCFSSRFILFYFIMVSPLLGFQSFML